MNDTPDPDVAADEEARKLLERLENAEPADAAEHAEALAEKLSERIEAPEPGDGS